MPLAQSYTMSRLIGICFTLLLAFTPTTSFAPSSAPSRMQFRTPALGMHHSLAMKRHVSRPSRGPEKNDEQNLEVDQDGIPKIGRLKNVVRQTRGDIVGTRGSVKVQGKRWDNVLPKPPTIRVVGGTAKGRKLNRPEVYLRPMMGKVKEALFSILTEFDVLRDDAIALDTFAGSESLRQHQELLTSCRCGSVGIEALSRGVGAYKAAKDFLQTHRLSPKEACSTIRGNLEVCEFENRGVATTASGRLSFPCLMSCCGTGLVVCSKAEAVYDDPVQVLAKLRKMGGKGFDLLTMTPPYEEVDYGDLLGRISKVVGNRLIGMRNRKYGRTMLAIYACNPVRFCVEPVVYSDTRTTQGPDVEPRPKEFGSLRLDYL
eukprot:758493-Hanusia_phi.AAC.4